MITPANAATHSRPIDPDAEIVDGDGWPVPRDEECRVPLQSHETYGGRLMIWHCFVCGHISTSEVCMDERDGEGI